MNLKRSNWIEDLVFPLAVAVLTAAWLGLWVLWVARAGLPEVNYPAVSPLLLGLLLAGSALLTRGALERTGQLGPARLLIVGAGLAAITAALWWTFRFPGLGAFLVALGDWGQYISPVLMALGACAFMWWQGIALTVANWPQQYLQRAFLIGILALALLFAVNQSNPVITPAEAVSTAVALFGAGLGALALVSFENARSFHEGATGTRLTLNRHWLITVASVIGAILALALGAATLFSSNLYDGVARLLRVVMDAVTFVVAYALAAVAALFALILFPILQALLNFGRPGTPDEVIEFSNAGTVTDQAQEAVQLFADNPALAAARQIVFLVLLVVGVGLLLWWSVRRLGQLNRRDSDEVRESIATRELVWGQLKQFLNRRKPAPAEMAPYLALAGPGDDPRLIVRRAYQSMLEWARTVTRSRAAGQTPASYGEALAHALPQGRAAITTLTLAYERARYSAEAPSLDEARTAQGALNELQALPTPVGAKR